MRAVVVGAGVGGLAAAARLAASGHAVTLLEAAPVVGGKLGRFERDGFSFDTGPSLLTMPKVFEDLFHDTGGWPSDLRLTRLEPLIRHRFTDGTSFDSGARVRANLEAWSPGAGDDWAAFLDRAQRIWAASRKPFLESALHGSRTLASLTLRHPGDLATLAPGRTLRDLGRRHLRDPRLRMVLDRYATYTGSDPRRAPAALAAVPWVEHAYGGWWVEGGLYRLAESLLDRCVELGVEVQLGRRVTRVAPPLVTCEDGELPADVVVSDTDAAHLYRDLVQCPPATRRLARATPSLSGFVLMLALRGQTPGLAHHTVLFGDDYDAEMDAVFGDLPAQDPAVYLSRPPGAAPDGHESLFVLVNAPRHGPVDWHGQPGYADHVLDVMARRGVDVRDRVLWREVVTPADLEQRTGAVGGAIYGTSSNGPVAAFLRPANRSPVPGLFLVGGSSHPGGGLPLVALSAQIVSGLIGSA
ncbi:MAG: putative UDP-galactopyranose mutase [Frankiales bacterium]|nr:putative UDP-galactopyranose mutase [Frankiales bacterium]